MNATDDQLREIRRQLDDWMQKMEQQYSGELIEEVVAEFGGGSAPMETEHVPSGMEAMQ